MAERKELFSLDSERFREIWDRNDWFNLQQEFKTNNIPLSDSLLKWEIEYKLYLTDFQNAKTYDIDERVGEDPNNPIVIVWERSSDEEQPVTSKNTEDILFHLQSAQGTSRGFINLFTRLDLDQIDLDKLKRAELSGAGFSFQPVQEDLLTVYTRLREILATRREWLLDLSSGEIATVNQYLQEFYGNVREIESFSPNVENPTETHASLQQDIIQRCDEAKKPLSDIVAFLSSRKIDRLETDVNATAAKAVDQLTAEVGRAKELIDEVKTTQTEMTQKADQLMLQMRNMVAEKPISQYKEIFKEQAESHKTAAKFWLLMAILATVAFPIVFFALQEYLKSDAAQLTGTLQSLFTKGFLLSPVYVWLNRSIKNHAAQKHLEVINTHRQKALDTFDAFVAAAEGNQETRDAVLLAATEAIFAANQTGYLSTKTTGPDNRSPVQQVIREIIPQKSATKDG